MDLYDAFAGFAKLSLSHKTICYFVARNLPDAKQDLYDYLFDYFDDKNNGTIGLESFRAVFAKHTKVPDKELS